VNHLGYHRLGLFSITSVDLHAECGLDQEGNESYNVNALVVLRNVHCDLQEQ
jgi:hypothetical protein